MIGFVLHRRSQGKGEKKVEQIEEGSAQSDSAKISPLAVCGVAAACRSRSGNQRGHACHTDLGVPVTRQTSLKKGSRYAQRNATQCNRRLDTRLHACSASHGARRIAGVGVVKSRHFAELESRVGRSSSLPSGKPTRASAFCRSTLLSD